MGLSVVAFSLQHWDTWLGTGGDGVDREPGLVLPQWASLDFQCSSGQKQVQGADYMAAEFLFSFEKHPNLKVVICKSFCVIWRSRYTSVRKVTEKSKSQSMLWRFFSCQRILRSHYFEWMGVAKIESQKRLLQTDDESEILIKNSFETRIPIKNSFGV